jgi:hypothetical protein
MTMTDLPLVCTLTAETLATRRAELLTGKRMNAPCCDVFRIVDGRIKTFNCFWSAATVLAQLGVLGNLEGAVKKSD